MSEKTQFLLNKSAEKEPVDSAENKKFKREKALQSMEVVLEKAEEILWQNPNAGWPDIVDKIIAAAENGKAVLGDKQKTLIGEIVQKWIEDVGRGIDSLKQLYLDGCLEQFEFGTVEFDNAWQTRQSLFEQAEEPWRLVESSDIVKHGLLVRFGLSGASLDAITVFADHPPMIVVQFQDNADYDKVANENSGDFSSDNSLGKASRNFSYFPDIKNPDSPQGLAGLRGCVAILRPNANENTRRHEEQHLFYGKYVAPSKEAQTDFRFIDELAAYLKTGDYNFADSGIFSNEAESGFYLGKTYSPEWLAVKHELMKLKWHGVPAEDLWSMVSLTTDFQDLVHRLKKVDVGPDDFNPGDYETQLSSWFTENHEQLPFEYYEKIRPHARKYLDNFLREWSVNSLDVLDNKKQGDEFKLYLLDQYWKHCLDVVKENIKMFPDLANQLMYVHAFQEVSEEAAVDRDSSMSAYLMEEQMSFVKKVMEEREQDLSELDLPEFTEKAETAESLLSKIEKWSAALSAIETYISETKQLSFYNIYSGKFQEIIQSVLGIDYNELDYYEKAKALKKLREMAFDKRNENEKLMEQTNELEEVLRAKDITPPFNLKPSDSFTDPFEFNTGGNRYLSELRKMVEEKGAKD